MKDHAHNKLSERPPEVDRTGILRAIDEIGNNDTHRAKSDLQLKKLRRNHMQTYDASINEDSSASSKKMIQMRQAKVNPTRDFSGY